MTETSTCCACRRPLETPTSRRFDQACWECQQDPDVMADVKLRGGRAVRQEMDDQFGEDGCLFDPVEGEES